MPALISKNVLSSFCAIDCSNDYVQRMAGQGSRHTACATGVPVHGGGVPREPTVPHQCRKVRGELVTPEALAGDPRSADLGHGARG
jgi:hypothetical protein